MTKFINTSDGNTLAYNQLTGKNIGIVFLSGFNSDMQGNKVLHIEKWAKDNNIPVSICGEMAGDTLFTMLLVGLNINSLSMGISSILKIKQFLNYLSFSEARKISGEILNDDDNISIKIKLEKYRNYVINNFS